MVLATAKIGDFVQSGIPSQPRALRSESSTVARGRIFQDPNETDRVWAVFDWDKAGWQSFTSGPRGSGDLSGGRVHARSTQVGGSPLRKHYA